MFSVPTYPAQKGFLAGMIIGCWQDKKIQENPILPSITVLLQGWMLCRLWPLRNVGRAGCTMYPGTRCKLTASYLSAANGNLKARPSSRWPLYAHQHSGCKPWSIPIVKTLNPVGNVQQWRICVTCAQGIRTDYKGNVNRQSRTLKVCLLRAAKTDFFKSKSLKMIPCGRTWIVTTSNQNIQDSAWDLML